MPEPARSPKGRLTRAAWLALSAMTASLACGPTATSGSGSQGESSETSAAGRTTTTASNGTTAAEATVGETSTDEATTKPDATSGTTDVGCVDNIANEPWCYRRFTVRGTARRGPHGRFGSGGTPRFFVHFDDVDAPALVGWDGDSVIVEPQLQLVDLLGPGNAGTKTKGLARGYDDVVRFDLSSSTRFVGSPGGLEPTSTVVYEDGESSNGPWTVADIDGDERDEIIVSHWPNLEGRPRLRVMQWTDDGFAFVGDPIEYNLEDCGVGLAMVAFDADADGFEDLAISTDCKSAGAEGQVYVIRGAASTQQMQAQISGNSSRVADGYWFAAYLMAAHDFDGDAVVDLALMNYDGYLSVMRGLGDGTWAQAKMVRDGDDNGLPAGVDGDADWEWAFADIDGEGVTEILAGRSVILDPLGRPAFVDYLPTGAVPRITIFSSAGDVSGDGAADLMVATIDDTVEILISDRH